MFHAFPWYIRYACAMCNHLKDRFHRCLCDSTSVICWSSIERGEWKRQLTLREIRRLSFLLRLNVTSHYFAHLEILSRSKFRSSAAATGSSVIIYTLVSSAKRRILEPISFTISFIYNRNKSDPSIDPCGTPAFFTVFMDNIPKICLYNVDPLKTHFYIVKLGFTVVYLYFSYFYSKT